MKKRLYFDTSIWLDFLENRNEPNLPKSDWAKELVKKIKRKGDEILFSDIILVELMGAGYTEFEIDTLFERFDNTFKVETTEKQIGKSKDLALKRDIPRGDALHAILARDNHAIFVTLDHDFKKLLDIVRPYRTNELL